MNFFITGLPRSRTAWLANFLTYDGNFCYHELCKSTSDPMEMKIMLHDPEYKNMGNSDCVFPYYYKKLLPLLSDYKIVIIERDPEEVIRDMYDLNIINEESESSIKQAYKLLDGIKSDPNHITVPYEKLNDMNTMKAIWDFLFGTKMDEMRWQEMDIQTIEVNWDKYMKYFKEENVAKLVEA